MSTQEQLIEALKAKFPDESQAGLARKAGLSVQRFNNYCTGIRTMDVDAVIGCAQAVGWDVRKTVAAHEPDGQRINPQRLAGLMWRDAQELRAAGYANRRKAEAKPRQTVKVVIVDLADWQSKHFGSAG